jgi:hypothetical protein
MYIGIVQLDFERINGDSTNQKTWDFMGKIWGRIRNRELLGDALEPRSLWLDLLTN